MINVEGFQNILNRQKTFYNSGNTKSLDFRISMLRKLKEGFQKYENEFLKSLHVDLHKPKMECYATELDISVSEIDHCIKNLGKWMKPSKKGTPLFFLPGSSYVHHEPFGQVLIISPWNYPVKNLFGPSIGAICAGNTMILKPSEVAPATSAVISKMVSEFFPEEYIKVIEGGIPETSELLKLKFDYILFTGASTVGKIVYKAAAENLTPVTLELGGKSPVIIDENVDLEVAAKRIAWAKFLNAGQICIAPDYIYVHKNIKKEFISSVQKNIHEFFGKDPSKSSDFGRIISDRHFQRISKLIKGKVIEGGITNESERYISPTIIDEVKIEDPVMGEEIFGPVMPVLEYSDVKAVINHINQGEKPLALYIFSNSSQFQNNILNNTSSGGVCINECIMHVGNMGLPFGGVGNSGTGSYNGKYGFHTFSHQRSVLKRSFMFDVKQRYAPYTDKNIGFIRWAIKKLL